MIADRLEALVIARAGSAAGGQALGELIQPLARFAPVERTPAAWREALTEVAAGLRARGVLDAEHRVQDAGELARRIGKTAARTWPQLADHVLPGLALGIAADDAKAHARLVGRDAWAAAIVGRALGLWLDGPPPSLAQLCDALAWRELGIAGVPKRCPPEIRALFVQRQLRSDAGPAERGVRMLAAREVGAPRPELRALREALVRGWLAGRAPGTAMVADTVTAAGDEAASDAVGDGAGFAAEVERVARAVREGRFGERKVFVAALWEALRVRPGWAGLALDDFKRRLLAAHRAGAVTLARADLVAAMDPAWVAASEIAADGASFHFLVQEPAT